jgi:hypothetical protein
MVREHSFRIFLVVILLSTPFKMMASYSSIDNFTHGNAINLSKWTKYDSSGSNIVIDAQDYLSITGNNYSDQNVLETKTLYPRSDDFSVEAVMRINATTADHISGLGWGDKSWALQPAGTDGYFIQFHADGTFRLFSKKAGQSPVVVPTGVSYTANQWYKIIMTVTGSNAVFKIYKDLNNDRDFLDAGEDVDILASASHTISVVGFDNKPIIIYGKALNKVTSVDYIKISSDSNSNDNGPAAIDAQGFYKKALVGWYPPVDASGVTDYQVEYSISGQNSWNIFSDGVSTDPVAVVTGLSDSSAYDFRVAALRSGVLSDYATGTATATTLASDIPSTIYHIPETGQSLSVGAFGAPALSTTQPYNNLSIDGQIFKDLYEGARYSGYGLDDGGDVETQSSAMANTLTNLSGTDFVTVVTRHGKGGARYSLIKKGTIYYDDLLDSVTKGKRAADLLGKIYIVPFVVIIHGESDQYYNTPSDTYAGYLEELQGDLNTDIRAITGQTQEVKLMTDQMSSTSTAISSLGQLKASEDNPGNIVLVTPKYMFDYADPYHLNNLSYRMLGEYYGKVLKKILIDGENWLPLSPKKIVRNGSNIYVSFNVPKPPIVVDTSYVTANTNYGFEFSKSGGNSSDITSVSLIPDFNEIKIDLSSTPTGTDQIIKYATTGIGAVPGRTKTTSQRGNIRDSDDTSSLYGNNLYDWLVHFSKDVVLDETSPLISSVDSVSVSDTSQSVVVNSNEEITSSVLYGPSSNLTSQTSTIEINTRDYTNTASLTNLLPCTKYYYKFTVSDLARNTGDSTINSFITTGCVGDAGVEDEADSFIATASGGVNQLSNITLTIPAGFTDTDATFQIKRMNKDTTLLSTGTPLDKLLVGLNIYDLKALSDSSTYITSFLEPINIKITYQNSDVSGMDKSKLSIYRYHDSVWSKLSNCDNDTILNTVSCPTDEFSVFGLFSESEPTNNNSATVSSIVSSGSYLPGFGPSIINNKKNTEDIYKITPTISCTVFNTLMKNGSRNGEVSKLQGTLNSLGFNSGPVDGWFGKLTDLSVKTYQKEHNLISDGVVGPITRASLATQCKVVN